MLVQFYAHENLIKVFGGPNYLDLLFTIPNAVRAHANHYLRFRYKASDWTKTTFGSEIELILTPEAKRATSGKANPPRSEVNG